MFDCSVLYVWSKAEEGASYRIKRGLSVFVENYVLNEWGLLSCIAEVNLRAVNSGVNNIKCVCYWNPILLL